MPSLNSARKVPHLLVMSAVMAAVNWRHAGSAVGWSDGVGPGRAWPGGASLPAHLSSVSFCHATAKSANHLAWSVIYQSMNTRVPTDCAAHGAGVGVMGVQVGRADVLVVGETRVGVEVLVVGATGVGVGRKGQEALVGAEVLVVGATGVEVGRAVVLAVGATGVEVGRKVGRIGQEALVGAEVLVVGASVRRWRVGVGGSVGRWRVGLNANSKALTRKCALYTKSSHRRGSTLAPRRRRRRRSRRRRRRRRGRGRWSRRRRRRHRHRTIAFARAETLGATCARN